ncbi:MAG: hypothetical protein PHS97_07725 [Oscillospiraceae bacterium]|nr:hypothetical protein [Oscillospiraceae bacterium]
MAISADFCCERAHLDLSFSFPDGIYGFLGGSDDDYASIIACLSGCMRTDRGHIALDGEIVLDSAMGVRKKKKWKALLQGKQPPVRLLRDTDFSVPPDIDDGTTLLFTQSRALLQKYCQRLCLLQDGKSQGVFDTAAVFERPDTLELCQIGGFSNLSPILKMDGTHFYAKEWGATLEADVVPDSAQWIAIRPDLVEPVAGAGENCIACTTVSSIMEAHRLCVIGSAGNGRLTVQYAGDRWMPGERFMVHLPKEHLVPIRSII